MDMTIKVSPELFKRLIALRDRHGDNTIADYLDRITEGPAWSLGLDEQLTEQDEERHPAPGSPWWNSWKSWRS
jgi:hypothetical protein